MNLQKKYYDLIKVPFNPFVPQASLVKTHTLIVKRRETILHYSKLLSQYRPVLFDCLIKIYYHPEITLLLKLISDDADLQMYSATLSAILTKNIEREFPHGDNHVVLINQFIESVATGKVQLKSF